MEQQPRTNHWVRLLRPGRNKRTQWVGALAGVALLGAACAGRAPSSEGTGGRGPATTAAAPATTPLPPVDAGKLEAAFGRGVAETKAPGGMALVRTPQGRFTVRYGTGTVGRDAPIQPADHFRIGSTTKTMVGAAILQLAQEDKLQLGDPVSRFRADVPNGDAITIEQLLTMRSGLASYTDTPELGAAVDRDPTRAWRPEELLALAFSLPPKGEPGAAFSYSNTNTVLLGVIAEQLDGKPLDQVLQDRLFGPLGMHETFLPAAANSDLPDPHTRGYLYGTNATFLRIDTALPPDQQAQLDAGTLPLNDVTDENPSWGWAAGAGISTAEDMVTWIDALVGGKVLNPEYQARWLEPGAPTDPTHPEGIRYGLAHYSIATPAGTTLYGHSGEIPGFNTWMLRDPVSDVTIVGWANLAPNHGDEAWVSRLIAQVYGPTTPAPTAPPTAPATDVAGLFDVGDGRKLYATCRGTGGPTVVLIAGKGNGAEDWQEILEPGDPVHAAAGDDLATGDDTSTPRAQQPHTVDLDVDDLHALLGALGEPGPFVLVAHSYGGLIANLYARAHPESVAGLVMVDAASDRVADVVSPARLRQWDATHATTSDQVREGVRLIDAIDRIRVAGPLPKVPAVVLASDKPWRVDLIPPEARTDTVTYDDWLASVDRLAADLGTTAVTNTASGHDIELYNPALVVASIQEVVDDARAASPPTSG